MKITIFRNLLIAAGIITLAGAGLSACGQSTETAGEQPRSDSMTSQISDSAMTAQVKVRLSTASGLEDSDISVSTRGGVVTLDGTVSDMDAKSIAERETKSVDGVRSVENNLIASANGMSMDNTQRVVSDSWITTKVKAGLLEDSFSKGFDVSVETRQGVVALSGVLEDQAAIDHVRNIAMSVDGVVNVDDSGLTHNGHE